ncbi:hypothetical protein LLE49_23235 [Alicyclobacillus tolerans]|uniref:hypothetical protein n=1 Tax=Alicyclobacillus tolerans TaxID=90970 RepID=UPI001F3B6EDC|nr:hypothetical protein [Alicyclobacillus tolerans]MCF8567637.1 hypothetical protein [Alicyclobacillus tolerans]
MIYCTVTTHNHLIMAQVMAQSVKQVDPAARVAICLVEDYMPTEALSCPAVEYVVLAKDLGFINFYRHIFKHSDIEGCTSVKARILLHMWEHFPDEDKFIYIDGDSRLYGRFDEVDELLDRHTLIVTPHITHPESSKEDVKNRELFLMQYGIYNLGFLALRKSQNARRFLEWWALRLEMYCVIDIPNQVFTDQRWIDYAPAFFDTYILKHPGYNVAWWNLNSRSVKRSPEGNILVDGQPLRFYHFSGVMRVKGDYSMLFERFILDKNQVLLEMIEGYVKDLQSAGQDFNKGIPWSYDYFTNGTKIRSSSRVVFRENEESLAQIHNPFELSNELFARLPSFRLHSRLTPNRVEPDQRTSEGTVISSLTPESHSGRTLNRVEPHQPVSGQKVSPSSPSKLHLKLKPTRYYVDRVQASGDSGLTYVSFPTAYVPENCRIERAILRIPLERPRKNIRVRTINEVWTDRSIRTRRPPVNRPYYRHVNVFFRKHQDGVIMKWDCTSLVRQWHGQRLKNHGIAINCMPMRRPVLVLTLYRRQVD